MKLRPGTLGPAEGRAGVSLPTVKRLEGHLKNLRVLPAGRNCLPLCPPATVAPLPPDLWEWEKDLDGKRRRGRCQGWVSTGWHRDRKAGQDQRLEGPVLPHWSGESADIPGRVHHSSEPGLSPPSCFDLGWGAGSCSTQLTLGHVCIFWFAPAFSGLLSFPISLLSPFTPSTTQGLETLSHSHQTPKGLWFS